uniref:Retrovirus-related Pol polyprotein from transposon TNT 1-94 n=1 Tax=Tanacetum cinerariifolium TaxID=118510 RepID=A0A6L2LZA6_TANCI|nr:retrovirus-related Pol polyprotein from transposon TNT 1-94 [Tanacetum cinerariifolium]
MANLSKDIQWFYCQGKENRVNILKSINEGPFQMGTFRETLAEGKEGALHLGLKRTRVYSDLSPDDKERFVTAMKLNKGLRDSNYDQLYAYLKQHEAHVNENKMMLDQFTKHTVDPLTLISNDSHQQLSPMDNLTKTLALLTQSYKTYIPQINNQLKTSSNTRNQAIVQDRRVVVQNFQGQHNRRQGNNARGTGAAGYGGAQNRVRTANLDLALNVDNVFQTDECDTFDFDVDEAPTAHTMFIENLSFADPVYDEAGLYYDLDILSEVQDHDNYQDAVCELHEVHEMHDHVQPNCVVDSDVEYTRDSNMIPYDQYVKDNAESVVQNTISSIPHDASMMKINEMHEQTAQCESVKAHTKVVNALLIVELVIYREQVELDIHTTKTIDPLANTLVQGSHQDESSSSQRAGPALKTIKGFTVYPPNTPTILVPRVLPTKSQVKINIFSLIQLFSEFEKTYKKRITPKGLTERERGFEQTKECYLTEVIPFFKTLKDHFEGIQKALNKEIKEMKESFEELEAEVDQNVVNRKHDEIERKKFLIANDNLIADCLSKEVIFIATNSELTVSRFTEMHDAHTVFQARCLELEAELSKLNDKIQKDDHNELVKHFSNLEVNHLNLQLKHQHLKKVLEKTNLYLLGILLILTQSLNNRKVHLDYLKHLKESVATLREVVEEARDERPLDRSFASACLYTKHSQELIEYMSCTCPKDFNKRDNKHASTSLTRKKQVTFEDQCETEDLGKWQPTADIGIFVGYAPSMKSYIIYNKRTRRIMETHHIQFDELSKSMAPMRLSTGPVVTDIIEGTKSKQNRAQNGKHGKVKSQQKSTQSKSKTEPGGFIDKFVCDPNKTPYSSQRPPQDCPKYGNPVDGLYCRHCALLRKKLKEQIFSKDFLNTIESSNDNSNVVNMPQEPIVFNQNPDENSSQSPPHIDHHFCYGDENSFAYDSTPNLVNNSPNVFNPPSQPPMYSYEFCRDNDHYSYDCPPQKIPLCYDDDDDEESSTPLRDIIISELPSCIAITPVLSTKETKDSLIMGDEHLDTIPKKEFDEFIKSSVKNFIPNPSESKDERECEVPACDDFTTFSNLLFDANDDFSSSDDDSFSDKDIPKEIYLNPLFKEEIISIKIHPHHFNAESDLIESLLNQDSSIISSSKIDSLLDEFAGELIFLKTIPPRINEADCDPEEEIHLIEKLLYDYSSPRLLEEFISKNYDAAIKSFSPSPIPVEDSDSLMEEIDLSFTLNYSMPSGIENDDYDSEGDMLILEESLSNDSFSLPENESFHFDIPSSLCPPTKPPDDDEIEPNSGILTVKVVGDISEHYVLMLRLLSTQPTLASNEEKSPYLLSHRGLKAF